MKLVLGMVIIWAAFVALSLIMPNRIEGPGNIDIGFQRLDVFIRYQMIAFAVALAAALVGVVWRRDVKRIVWVGLAPILVTLILFVGLFGVSQVMAMRSTPFDLQQQTSPVATIAAPIEDAQD